MFALAQRLLFRARPAEDDRLLRLYWNRAELKQEFSKLRRERDRLNGQLRQQEGTTLRLQQRMEHLELLLANPGRAANAVVFYQLRGVWTYVRRRLTDLARERSARQLEQERQREFARQDEHRQAALAAIDSRLGSLRERRAALEEDLSRLSAEQLRLLGFWNLFRRRSLQSQTDVVQTALRAVVSQIERYETARRDKLNENTGTPEVLSVDGKRVVNRFVIALAQEMLLEFMEQDVARMAREASLRTVHEQEYGDIGTCRVLGEQIEAVLHRVEASGDLAERVARRAEYLRQEISYRADADTVPVAASIGPVPLVLTDGDEPVPADRRTVPVNVLAEEYWDLYSTLLS